MFNAPINRDNAAIELINEAGSIYLATHIIPDGDAIASTLGLYWALRKMGKGAVVACADPVPTVFTFLPGADSFLSRPPADEDLIIILDCNALDRVGSLYDEAAFQGKPVVNIDHHISNLSFGTVNWVKTDAASTSEMLFDLIVRLMVRQACPEPFDPSAKLRTSYAQDRRSRRAHHAAHAEGSPKSEAHEGLDPQIATCLLTGIVTDTLGFRTSSTTPRLMQVVSQLMTAGASLADITDQVFNQRSLSSIKLWGKAIDRLQADGRVVWTEITQEMIRQSQGKADIESREGSVVNLLATIREADVAIVFKEREDGQVEVSMRGRRGVDLSKPALRLGGGGHRQAAGCMLKCSLEEAKEKVLAEVMRSLGE
ncbi:MAG: bifunctional oligoribonuclease/PAP phosphatase NrnA [Anaerolineae bacterium]